MRLWHYLRRLARRLLIATLIVAGALCGVVAVVFHYLIELAQSLLIEPAMRQHGLIAAAAVLDLERFDVVMAPPFALSGMGGPSLWDCHGVLSCLNQLGNETV